MKVTKLLKKCILLISTLMVAGLLAACSSPSGSSSDSDKDKDKKQNGEQQDEEESGESENLNEKKAQILKQMLGTYKPEGSESLEIRILKDKIVISQYGAENEISISKLQLAQELEEDDILYNDLNYYSENEVEGDSYYYWEGEPLSGQDKQLFDEYMYEKIKDEDNEFFKDLDKERVYLYNGVGKYTSELKTKPAYYSKDSNILMFAEGNTESGYTAATYYVLDPDVNQIRFIMYSKSNKEKIGTFVRLYETFVYWHPFWSNYGASGEWSYQLGGIGNFSKEEIERFEGYMEKVKKDAEQKYDVDESDSYEIEKNIIFTDKCLKKVADADDDDDDSGSGNSGSGSETDSAFEGITWKYAHENVSSTTTQNVVFENGTITVKTITTSNNSNTSTTNREETASYELDGDKITITYSKYGYDTTAEFAISVDGNTLTLESDDDDYDAISLLGTLFQNSDGTSKMSFTLSGDGSASDSDDDEDDSNSTIKASDIENITWKYQYEYNNWYFEFKNGKVTQRHVIQGSSMGGLEGTYKLKGDKLTVTYQSRYDGSDITGTVRLSFIDYGLKLDAEGDTNAGYVVNGFFEGSDGKQYLNRY